jgi:hypothetical protein
MLVPIETVEFGPIKSFEIRRILPDHETVSVRSFAGNYDAAEYTVIRLQKRAAAGLPIDEADEDVAAWAGLCAHGAQ